MRVIWLVPGFLWICTEHLSNLQIEDVVWTQWWCLSEYALSVIKRCTAELLDSTKMNEDPDCWIFYEEKLQVEYLDAVDIIFGKWDSLELNCLSKVKITLHNAKLREAIKRWYLTLLSGHKIPARWRHGGQDWAEIGNTCEHLSGIFSIQIWSPGAQCVVGELGQGSIWHADHLGHRKDKPRQLLHKCVLKATLRLPVMIDCEKSKTRHRNQQPVGENKCNWQSKSTKSTGLRWQPSFDDEEIFLVSGELGSVKVWWDGRGWKDGGIFKPTHSRQISNPVRCLRWLVFKNTAVSAAAQIFTLLR